MSMSDLLPVRGGQGSSEVRLVAEVRASELGRCLTCCRGEGEGAGEVSELSPARVGAGRRGGGVLIASYLVEVVRLNRGPSPSGDPAARGNDVQDLFDHTIRTMEV